jgi:hypothetical protein
VLEETNDSEVMLILSEKVVTEMWATFCEKENKAIKIK